MLYPKGGLRYAGHDFIGLFYGDEEMQFTYFRIPRQFIKNPRFKYLSMDSKLLYGMLFDRMSLLGVHPEILFTGKSIARRN